MDNTLQQILGTLYEKDLGLEAANKALTTASEKIAELQKIADEVAATKNAEVPLELVVDKL